VARYADDYVTGQLVLASIYWSMIGTGIILFEVQADVKLRAAPHRPICAFAFEFRK
jgi:hypothetical protein